MGDIKVLYGPPTAVNISLNGLATGSYQQSDVVDNSGDLYVDFIVQLTVDYPNAAPSGGVSLYFAASLDGVTFDGTGVTGVDGVYASQDTGNVYNMFGISPIQNAISSNSANFTWYQGYVPPFFSFVVINTTTETLGPSSALTVIGVKVQQ